MLTFTLQDFVGRMTKIEERFWMETNSFLHSSIPKYSDDITGKKGTPYPYVHAPHTQNPHNSSLSRLKKVHKLKLFEVNQTLYIQLKILTFL